MKKHLVGVVFVVGMACAAGRAQTPATSVLRLDPALDAIISPAATLEVVAFGGADGRTLYVTLGAGLARIRLNAPAI